MSSENLFSLEQAGELTGLSQHTIRYYERMGLMSPARKRSFGQRCDYTESDIARLHALACMREAGLSIHQMRDYFKSAPRSTRHVTEVLQRQQRMLEQRVQQMQRQLESIKQKIAYWRAVEAAKDRAVTEIAEQIPERRLS
jgi:MerR family transcriptional regulator, aldehyde-responsive regulator